jgi:hypothetical protein
MTEDMKKVRFPIEILRYSSEIMWCLPITGNTYVLASLPFLHDIPPRSIIEVEEDEYGDLIFSKLVEKAESTVYHCVGLSFDRVSFSKDMKNISTEVWSEAWGISELVYVGAAVPKGEKKEEVLKALNTHGLWCPILAKDSDACDIVLYRNLLSAKKLLKLHKPALLEEKIIW